MGYAQVLKMIDRDNDVGFVMSSVADGACCAVLGISNIGKSTLLRALATQHAGASDDAAKNAVFVYVDLNLISQCSEQGFYEVVLRNMLVAFGTDKTDTELSSTLRRAYETVIAPNSPFLVPLAFEDSLQAITSRHSNRLVLLFDEFDEVFAELEPRVFVRLRALRDRHAPRLCYVTATGSPLAEIRRERQVGEFCELFAAHTRYLLLLAEDDARILVEQRATQARRALTPQDIDFVVENAGGHPALLQTTCAILLKSREEPLWWPATEGYERIRQRIDSDANTRLECAKLWADLSVPEQEALIAMLSGQNTGVAVDLLVEKGLVRITSAGPQIFASLFASFVQRQQMVRRRGPAGLRIDVDAGDVWVDGRLAPTLTDLEYKLLLLLYGNLDKIIDKYKIVETVWGESYIEQVDDARIEKLVSRLREKIEPKPAEPRYLITVRGRGYRLVSPP
ncbi:MAG: winged helix-turn-helix transcriptional regulator [Chloroflexi bacterium]|nr:winged helix-turn-helix transcriptional regulator [Chloroflexota bacterium]